MTLTVQPWIRDGSGNLHFLNTAGEPATLAGTESTRHDLWGSPAVRALGATFLPRLADDDLWVELDELDAFEAECTMLLAHSENLGGSEAHGADYVRFRLNNMIDAARMARRAGGGVVIE